MNAEAIRSRIVGTLSADANVRRQAELELKSVRIAFFFSVLFFSFLLSFSFPYSAFITYHTVTCRIMPYSLCLSCQCNQALRQANGIVYLPLSPRSLPSLAVLIPSSPFSISIFYVQCVWQEKANLYLLHVNRPRVTLASSMYYLTFWVPRLKIPYDYQVC